MRNFTIYLTGFLCLFLTKAFSQETFEERAKLISSKIEAITKEEKAALRTEIEAVNTQLDKGAITSKQGEDQKTQLAETHAKNIENRVSAAQDELKSLVQEKVDGKLKEQDSTRKFTFRFDAKKDKKKDKDKGESRSTSQFVLAFGLNNLMTDGALAHSDFGYLRSHFAEWGFTDNIRILKNSNLLHFKYGLSFVYNSLHATENRYFEDNLLGETVLVTAPTHLRTKDTYFRNVFLTLPVHLEFDFSKTETKDGKKVFRSHEGFRVGMGGFVGYNTNSKQFLSYKVDGYRINERQKGNWNIEDWNYGVSAYVGYKEISLYVKYDINPMFKNNAVDQNNISGGLRFDFN